MFRRILVPIELSDKDLRAVEAARSLARSNEEGDTEVALLHVIETLDLPFEELEDFYGKLESRAAAVLNDRRGASNRIRLSGSGDPGTRGGNRSGADHRRRAPRRSSRSGRSVVRNRLPDLDPRRSVGAAAEVTVRRLPTLG